MLTYPTKHPADWVMVFCVANKQNYISGRHNISKVHGTKWHWHIRMIVVVERIWTYMILHEQQHRNTDSIVE